MLNPKIEFLLALSDLGRIVKEAYNDNRDVFTVFYNNYGQTECTELTRTEYLLFKKEEPEYFATL